MRVFITGATGFIGSQVAQILSDKGHELVCLFRNRNEKTDYLNSIGAQLIRGDITNKSSLLEGMRICDAAIHLAAIYSFWIKDDRDYWRVNVDGTRNVMECALEHHLKKIIHVSTAITFGKPSDHPYTETSKPGLVMFSKYAKSKHEGNQVVWDLYKNKSLPVVMIYPGGVLGAGDPKSSGNYISNFIHGKMPATVLDHSSITWVHVHDVADGIVKALEKKDNIGESYILAKHYISFADFNKIISEISGVPAPKMAMSDAMTVASAKMLTGLAAITGKEPSLGMSTDQIRTMKNGFYANGSKAERELGLVYTPLRKAIEDEVRVATGAYLPHADVHLEK